MSNLLSDAEIADLRKKFNEGWEPDTKALAAIRSQAELIGWLVSESRERGLDEVTAVDALIRIARPSRESVRESERLLRRLHYTAVSDHLRKLARRFPPAQPCRWDYRRVRTAVARTR